MVSVTKKATEELVSERQQMAKAERVPIALVADNIRSLDNVGLLFRLSELARLEKLYLAGYTGYPRLENDARPKEIADRHQRRIEKTAVYALSPSRANLASSGGPLQPWEHAPDPLPLIEQMKQDGRTIIALEQTDQSVPYHELQASNYQLPITLLLGHERQGVRQELLDLADHIIDIPILGQGNSHNVAIAAGIVVYHILAKTEQI